VSECEDQQWRSGKIQEIIEILGDFEGFLSSIYIEFPSDFHWISIIIFGRNFKGNPCFFFIHLPAGKGKIPKFQIKTAKKSKHNLTVVINNTNTTNNK
jgi:hypothetical protein